MQYISKGDITLSRFSLGTVQLGMAYGLSGHNAAPSEEKAFEILDQAMEIGVNNLDTANNYRTSEKIIGSWLRKRKEQGLECPWVTTKVGPFQHTSADAVRDQILRQAEGCLETLGVDTIDCLMVHNFEDFMQSRDVLCKTFAELKAQKLCRTTGLSAYSENDYNMIAESGFDSVQIPLNVFDWTHIENGDLDKLMQANMMVFVRSVFLQGLVFQKPETLEDRISFCLPYLKEYLRLCEEFQLAPEVLALSFILSLPPVTTVVLGCDTAQQVQANGQLMDKTVSLTEEQLSKLHAAFHNVDPRVLDPRLWPKRT